MKKSLLLIIILSVALSSVGAQEKEKSPYLPKVFGFIKFRYEVDAYNGDNRFNMNNSRLGVKGLLPANVSYAIQMELSANGKIELLDASLSYQINNFELSVGQQQYHLSTEHDRGPANNYFANSALSGTYTTQYYYQTVVDGVATSTTLGSIGARDMGATLSYTLSEVPLKFMIGAFNGIGINRSEWNNHVNFIGRISYGDDGGFGAAASYYQGSTPYKSTIIEAGVESQYRHNIKAWAGELRYVNSNLRVEGEVTQRFLSVYGRGSDRLTTAMVYGLYKFDMENCKLFKYIAPVARWDYIDNLRFANAVTGGFDSIDTHRATIGVSFGLTDKLVSSEVRINYEHYLPRNKPSDNSVNRTFHNRFMLEFVAAF